MTPIIISDITTTYTDGNGIFDVLMRAVDAHLSKQYDTGRIKGSDYATVYLGAVQSVLQQAVQFTLTKQKIEKDILLIEEQIIASTAKTARELSLATEQIAASVANTAIKQTQSTKDALTKDAQVSVYTAQTAGFDRDYKTKVVKMLLDIRSTALTQGYEGIASESGDAIIKDIVLSAGLTWNANTPPTHTGQFLVDPIV